MGTTLATKQDLDHLKLATKQDFALARQEIQLLKQDMDSRFVLVDQKFDTMELRMTVKLGSMMIAGFGLTITALRFWS